MNELEIIETSNSSVDVELFNKENKKSVYNLMPQTYRTKLDEMGGLGEYTGMEEWEIKREIKLTPTLNRLRYSFWNEYYRAIDNGIAMKGRNVYAGVCSVEVYHKILKSKANIAWILTPPTDTVTALRETLHYGFDRIREILDLPLYKVESVRVGKDEWEDREVVDEKVAQLMLKAVAMIDLRLHGSYVQVHKVEQKTTNVNLSMKEQPHQAQVVEVDDIDKKLLELRNEVLKDVNKVSGPILSKEIAYLDEQGINVRELPVDKVKLEKSEVLEKECPIEDVNFKKITKKDVEDL